MFHRTRLWLRIQDSSRNSTPASPAKRDRMTANASSEWSASTKRRPSASAAAPVVPLPATRSTTSPPAGEDAR